MLRIAVALLVLASTAVSAEKPAEAKPDHSWKGSVEDLGLLKDVPLVIADSATFEKTWKSWKVGDLIAEVDFKKSVVVIVHGRGGTLDMRSTIDEQGNLQAVGFGTKDLRPGFRYVIGVFKRDGVKTINGKEIPKS